MRDTDACLASRWLTVSWLSVCMPVRVYVCVCVCVAPGAQIRAINDRQSSVTQLGAKPRNADIGNAAKKLQMLGLAPCLCVCVCKCVHARTSMCCLLGNLHQTRVMHLRAQCACAFTCMRM
jgi:hypothetical protein